MAEATLPHPICPAYPLQPRYDQLHIDLRRIRAQAVATGLEEGRRKGTELKWVDLVSGDAALATALQASVDERRYWLP